MITYEGPKRVEEWALFLDVDGTIVEIAESPDAVHVPDALLHALQFASERESGALALVSGRSLADLDKLFSPHRFTAAALHGLERRNAAGCLLRPAISISSLDGARAELHAFAVTHPGLLVEDKGLALALHFRRAQELAPQARVIVERIVASMGPAFHIQPGKCVLEIKPANFTKRTAIEAFMREAPFVGRRPVFVGDDLTDEDGFQAVNAMHGLSVRVGASDYDSAAQYRLSTVAATIQWLRQPAQSQEARGT